MSETNKKPMLIFDGDCGICRYWVNYWQGLTGDTVEYQPYQTVAKYFHNIPVEEFRRSIQLITPVGHVYSGAQAVYVLLQAHFPHNVYLWLYQHIPGFASAAEFAYTFFSQRRGLLSWLSHLFWGSNLEPAKYEFTTWLFLRLLGLIYLAAFASFGLQITGLIGDNGILPLGLFLERVQTHVGATAVLQLPTIFWLSHTDIALIVVCGAGIIFSVLLACNVFVRTSLMVLFVLWLSLVNAGQTFMQFQWDLLLVECGFLALFLQTRSTLIVWLYRWLAFRFMFMGGVVKIASADPAWDNLTALTYHFETQPLPNAIAWYVHQLPDSVLMLFTGATLFIELLLPFFIFLPRRLRFIAAYGFIALQTAIILTGNYNYFNLLTLAFCLFLFDDAALRSFVPEKLKVFVSGAITTASVTRLKFYIALAVTVIVISTTTAQLWQFFTKAPLPVLHSVARVVSPLNAINQYGPFAVMTTVRREIVIEGSNDEKEWREYGFKYKPGDLQQRPEWIVPHQPRMDWQMWFAALSPPERQPWFRNVLIRLLQGSPDVLALFAHNPFPDQPPAAIRAMFYEYRFTTFAERRETGQWWEKKLIGVYHPAGRLSGN